MFDSLDEKKVIDFKCAHCGYDHGEIVITVFNTWDYLYGCPKCPTL